MRAGCVAFGHEGLAVVWLGGAWFYHFEDSPVRFASRVGRFASEQQSSAAWSDRARRGLAAWRPE